MKITYVEFFDEMSPLFSKVFYKDTGGQPLWSSQPKSALSPGEECNKQKNIKNFFMHAA